MTSAPARSTDFASSASCCGGKALPSAAELESWAIPDLIARFRKGVENFDRRMFWLNESQIDTAFLPEAGVGRWPVRVLLGHLADAELSWAHRLRKTVAEENPTLQPWDEEAFIDANVYGHMPHAPAATIDADTARVYSSLGGFVAVIHTLRRWSAEWLETLAPEQWSRNAMHPEKGPLTVKRMVALDTWHVEHHAKFLNAKIEKIVSESDLRDRSERERAGAASGGGGGGSCGSGCGCGPKS